ncbi:MAG: imidazole glycerol phosphate synthase subunit HisH [Chloroflexi bacterium]|nr:imidazole glycerol phosphate synthase subunit HisH [Chloroflexota bacterium]
MIAIIDYGAGNIRNVLRALTYLGHEASITADRAQIQRARAVVLPGVGAAGDTVRALRDRGLDDLVRRTIEEDRPFLGVCIGLQVLFDTTEEGGFQPCLGILPGAVKRLPAGLKVPHMGWNQVQQRAESPVFLNLPDGANFYFVHSYYVEPAQRELVAAETSYGVDFCCAVARGNLFATQFHPEKSGPLGLRVYDNFLKATLGRHTRH